MFDHLLIAFLYLSLAIHNYAILFFGMPATHLS